MEDPLNPFPTAGTGVEENELSSENVEWQPDIDFPGEFADGNQPYKTKMEKYNSGGKSSKSESVKDNSFKEKGKRFQVLAASLADGEIELNTRLLREMSEMGNKSKAAAATIALN